MVMAHRTKDAKLIAHTASVVVLADTIFTATAVIVQPITGWLLARALGCAILYRTTAQRACLGMIAGSLLYLKMASVVTPDMWLDPLGPLGKVLPAVGLAAITHSLLERR
jgi:uncharacterized membrane protein